MRTNRNNEAGFTLVELVIAIAILALVAVLGWRGLDGIVRAREDEHLLFAIGGEAVGEPCCKVR